MRGILAICGYTILFQLAHQLQTLSINEVCCICPAMSGPRIGSPGRLHMFCIPVRPSTPLVLRLALVAAAARASALTPAKKDSVLRP